MTNVWLFAIGSAALAAPMLKLVSGAATPIIVAAGPGGYSNPDFNGWDVIISFGTSNSPGLEPYGLDLTNLVKTCSNTLGCASDPLTIYLSDTGFTQVSPGLAQAYSATASGVSTQTAYADTGNTLFGISGPTAQQIGSVTLTNTGAGEAASVQPVGPAPYSLTLVDTFEPNNGAGVFFSADGDITLPEPTSLMLFASGLMGLGWVERRRKRI